MPLAALLVLGPRATLALLVAGPVTMAKGGFKSQESTGQHQQKGVQSGQELLYDSSYPSFHDSASTN